MNPPDLNLDEIKVGDEVVTLTLDGCLSINSTVYLVHSIESDRVRVRRPDKTNSTHSWLTKNKGGCPWAMHDQNVMRFWYSANPAHIAIAKAHAVREKAAKEEAERAHQVLLDLARPIGQELGDGWDSEEGYQRETAAQTLASNLTPEQMATLKGWLKIA